MISAGLFLCICRTDALCGTVSSDGVSCQLSKFQAGIQQESRNHTVLDGFCDVDWGTSDTCRSTAVTIYRFNGAPIHWKTKLQKTISLSTAELGSGILCRIDGGRGHHLPSCASQEDGFPTGGIHARLQRQQFVYRMEQQHKSADRNGPSTSTFGSTSRMKRFRMGIQKGHLQLVRVSTADQLADLFTKSLQLRLHAACLSDIRSKRLTQDRKGRRGSEEKSGCIHQKQAEPRRPLQGVCRRVSLSYQRLE
jgi:hypothetical protein